jgi:D-lactate dehydrogenase (cytochrome)
MAYRHRNQSLKLYGLPEAVSAGVCRFPTIKAACDAAIAAIQIGLPMARVELLDDVMVRACNAYSKLNLPEAPMLFVEFHGQTL